MRWFLLSVEIRNDKGQMQGYNYIVYPQSQNVTPITENPKTDSSKSENPHLQKKHNTKETKTKEPLKEKPLDRNLTVGEVDWEKVRLWIAASPDDPIAKQMDICDKFLHKVESEIGKLIARSDNLSYWKESAKKLLEVATPDQIRQCLRFALSDDFFRQQVVSLPTFQSQFDKIKVKYKSSGLIL